MTHKPRKNTSRCANSKDIDQPALMCRLISVFTFCNRFADSFNTDVSWEDFDKTAQVNGWYKCCLVPHPTKCRNPVSQGTPQMSNDMDGLTGKPESDLNFGINDWVQ